MIKKVQQLINHFFLKIYHLIRKIIRKNICLHRNDSYIIIKDMSEKPTVSIINPFYRSSQLPLPGCRLKSRMLVFSHLGFWSGNLFLIAPFPPDLCLLVPFYYRDSYNPYEFTTIVYLHISSLKCCPSKHSSFRKHN